MYLLVSHSDAENDNADHRTHQHDDASKEPLVGRVAVCMYYQMVVSVSGGGGRAGGVAAVILVTLANVLPDDEQDTN